MAKNSQKSCRVLRKRKEPANEVIEKKKKAHEPVSIQKKCYDVWNEHNYFNSDEKIRNRWRGKYSNKIPLENENNNTDFEDSLPDWLKTVNDSSDEDDVIDNSVSLSKILETEQRKDLENARKKKRYAKNLSSLSKKKKTKKPELEIVKTISVGTSIESAPKPSKICSHLLGELAYSVDLRSTSPDLIIDLTDDSIDDVQTVEETIQNDSTAEVLSLFPTIVYPPFSMINLIHLAIKNSSTEYVTDHSVQQFCRNWFPYFGDKILIRAIRSTFKRYGAYYFNCELSLFTNKSDMWTVNKKSVSTLEQLLMSAVENNEDKIKLSMRNSDKYSVFLKGYGLYNLGHDQNNKITQA